MRTVEKAPDTRASHSLTQTNEATERLERWLARLRAAGERRAQARSKLVGLEHRRKVLLAVLSKEFSLEYPSVAAQEREARASDDYSHIIDEIEAAELEFGRADAEWEALRLYSSLWQSVKATERAELRAFQ
jgi:hypothetical protein